MRSLESAPAPLLIHWIFACWMHIPCQIFKVTALTFTMSLCMPLIGWAAMRGDVSTYRYLLKGSQEFPNAETLATELSSLGFEDVSFKRLSLEIVAIHVARKPLSEQR